MQCTDGDRTRVDVAQSCERRGQYDLIGDDVACPTTGVEAADDPPVRALAEPDEPVAEVEDASRQPSRMPEISWSLPPWMCHFSSPPPSWGDDRGCRPLVVLLSSPSR